MAAKNYHKIIEEFVVPIRLWITVRIFSSKLKSYKLHREVNEIKLIQLIVETRNTTKSVNCTKTFLRFLFNQVGEVVFLVRPNFLQRFIKLNHLKTWIIH